MAFLDKSKGNFAFKALLGKAHTTNDRDIANEAIASGILLTADRIFADKINSDPLSPLNGGIVSGLVTLNLTPVSGSPVSYTCHLSAGSVSLLSSKINPLTGVNYASGDRVGNIINDAFGLLFRPKLYNGAIEVSPTHESDWFLDPFAGVITQEDVQPVTTLQCYIYIGRTVTDRLGSGGSGGGGLEWLDSVLSITASVPTSPSTGDRYLLEIPSPIVKNDNGATSSVTTVAWTVIDKHANEGWVLTPPTVGMMVSVDNDTALLYQYNGTEYTAKYFERTYPTIDNKGMTSSVTTGDGTQAVNIPVSKTPSGGSYIEVLLNGVQIPVEDTGNALAFVTSVCYFSSDGGLTSKLMKDVKAGDYLYWMTTVATFDLDATDKITFNYVSKEYN